MSDLELLRASFGRYAGHGINHEDQPFHGELELESLYDRGALLGFRATGIDGVSYHEERSWIAVDGDGRLCLWTVNTNHAACLGHAVRHGAAPGGTRGSVVFGHGDPRDASAYRSEVAIDVWPNGDLGYRHAWGLPGGEFLPRSSVRMSPAEPEG